MATMGAATNPAAERQAERLRLLHDVLATTPMSGRYWMFAGTLLGWAREGQLLGHDCDDADFMYRTDDEERLQASFPALAQAGFRLARTFPGVGQPPTQWALSYENAIFDFFAAEFRGDRLRYHSYGTNADPAHPHSHLQNVSELPASPLEEFYFLGRWWLKAADHDAELTGNYADWRTPEPGWDYMRGPSIVERRPWDPTRYEIG
jgi:hypothetical protein